MSNGVSQVANDVFIMDRSFLRLKSLEFGYTLPDKWMESMRIERLRVYMNGNNLLTFKKMPIDTVDPEQSGTLVYPLTRLFNFGLNISF